MVAEEMNTAPLGRVSATPLAPNKMVSVCAALTTTLTTMSAPLAASAGVLAPLPPSATNRLTDSAETSQPVTAKPARRSEVAMPNPIEPSPITATLGFTDSGIRRSLRNFLEHDLSENRYPLFRIMRIAALPLGITAWPRCQSMRQGGQEDAAMSETNLREEICCLGPSLFQLGHTPGSSGHI